MDSANEGYALRYSFLTTSIHSSEDSLKEPLFNGQIRNKTPFADADGIYGYNIHLLRADKAFAQQARRAVRQGYAIDRNAPRGAGL